MTQTLQCPVCQADLPADPRRCPACGSDLTLLADLQHMPDALADWALAHLEKGDPETGLIGAGLALELDPDHPAARNARERARAALNLPCASADRK